MQTVISSLAHTFVADAMDLARGAVGLIRNVMADVADATRHALAAPVDRLARACDVADMLPDAAPRHRRKGFDPLGIRGAMRTLRDVS
ncbi:MAG: hypothetical protein ABWY18_00095 [Tardiphaga sp.]